MLVKLTSKRRITLPRAVVSNLWEAEYFEVTIEGDRIVLTPVRTQKAHAVLSASGASSPLRHCRTRCSREYLLRESMEVRIDPVGQRVGDSFSGKELLFQSAFGQRE